MPPKGRRSKSFIEDKLKNKLPRELTRHQKKLSDSLEILSNTDIEDSNKIIINLVDPIIEAENTITNIMGGNDNINNNRQRKLEHVPVDPYEGNQEDFEDFFEEYKSN